MGDVITSIDKFKKGWKGGLPETPCGSGSMLRNTIEQRQWIPKIIKSYEVRTIADVGAGDLNWISKTVLPEGVDIKFFDLVPRSILVREFDIVKQVPEQYDMLMCLWVLNHLPMDQHLIAYGNLLKSQSRYLMITDRVRWHCDYPKEVLDHMLSCTVEKLVLNNKNDAIRLVRI